MSPDTTEQSLDMPITPTSTERPAKRQRTSFESSSAAEDDNAMSSIAGATQLLDLLLNPDVIQKMLTDNGLARLVTDEHQEALAVLHQHFGHSDTALAVTEPGPRKAKQPQLAKNKAKAKDGAGPWQRFIKLKALKVPDAIKAHIDQHGIDASAFMNQGTSQQAVKDLNGKKLKDIFKANYRRTVELEKNSEMDHVTSLFYMLLYYDICRMVQPAMNAIGNDASLLADILTFINQVVDPQDATINTDKAAQDVKRWFEHGAKLNIFVAKFGPGCLFVLGDQLSDRFVKSKTQMLLNSGMHYTIAMNHMSVNLQMGTLLRTNRLDKLGKNVREFLMRPFEAAHEDEQEGEPGI